MGSQWVFAIVLVAAVWVCGCFAQAQKEIPLLPLPSGPLESKSCVEIRDSLERMLYVTLKGSLPRRMLKEVLPGLVEPLLPVMCLQPGSDASKWLQLHHKLPSSSLPLSRPKRQISMFLPFLRRLGTGTGRKIKDPGDHPPPGMTHNPFKDPGDRPLTLFGMPIRKVKDPQDRLPAASGGGGGGEAPPPGEPLSVNPMMSQMMAMMQMMNFNRQMARMTAAMKNNNGNNGGKGNTSG